MSHQCHECPGWNKCPLVPEWWSEGVIRFCPYQTRWLMEHKGMIEEGRWPVEPKETGYTGSDTRMSSNATFEMPICVIAELNLRLGRCDKNDRLLAIKVLTDKWDYITIAELTGRDPYNLERRVDRVIRYCSGVRRKKYSYDDFKQHRRR